VVICEKNSTNAYGNLDLLDVHPMMKGDKKKTEKQSAWGSKQGEKEIHYYIKSSHSKDKFFWNFNNLGNLKEKLEIILVNEISSQQLKLGTWKKRKT
jgi:hypothetical protein